VKITDAVLQRIHIAPTENSQRLEAMLAVFFLGVAYVNLYTLKLGPLGRWVPYGVLLFSAAALILCSHSKLRNVFDLIPLDAKKINFLIMLSNGILLAMTIHLANKNLGYAQSAAGFFWGKKIFWVMALFSLIILAMGIRKSLRGGFSNLILLLMIAIGAMEFRYISETTLTKPWVLLLLIGLTGIASIAFFPRRRANIKPKTLEKLAFHILFFPILFALSFRTDYLSIGGALYHLEYFFGPITTLKAGEALLFTQPSQYGFLNILLPSLLPFGHALKNFHLFHSLLLFAVANLIPMLFLRRSTLTEYIFLFVCFVTTLFFTDPAAIGPNGFPSSSVMRFFPVFLFILALQYRGKDWFRTVYCTPFFVMLFAALWNFEGFFYVALGSAFLAGSHLGNPQLSPKEKYHVAANSLILFGLSCLGGILIANAYTLGSVGSFANLNLYWMHPFVYANGLGAVPLSPFGPQLLVVIPIGAYLLCQNTDYCRPIESGLIGCLLGVLSYYYGRSVPNNLEAMFPVLFIICLLLFREERLRETAGNTLRKSDMLIVTLSIIFAVTTSSLIFSLTPEKIFKMNPQVIINDAIIAATLERPPAGLRNLQKKIAETQKTSEIHVSYYGYMSPMQIDPAYQDRFKPWLPSPAALILSPETKKSVVNALAHSKLFQNNDGYLIIDVKNSDPSVVNYLLDLIQLWKKCDLAFDESEYHAYFCRSKTISPL